MTNDCITFSSSNHNELNGSASIWNERRIVLISPTLFFFCMCFFPPFYSLNPFKYIEFTWFAFLHSIFTIRNKSKHKLSNKKEKKKNWLVIFGICVHYNFPNGDKKRCTEFAESFSFRYFFLSYIFFNVIQSCIGCVACCSIDFEFSELSNLSPISFSLFRLFRFHRTGCSRLRACQISERNERAIEKERTRDREKEAWMPHLYDVRQSENCDIESP